MIARHFACAVIGAVVGVLLAMCVAVAYARPAPHLSPGDAPYPGPPIAIDDAVPLVLLTTDEGIWTIGRDQVDYVRRGERPVSVNFVGAGFGASRLAAVDAFDGSLWMVTARNELVRIDAAGTIHPAVRVAPDATAIAIGLEGGTWIATSDELVHISGDGTLGKRLALPANTGARRMIVDTLRSVIFVAFAEKVVAVSYGPAFSEERTETILAEGVRSIAVDPLSGDLWVLFGNRIDRYSAAGPFIQTIDLRSHGADGAGFVSIAYDGELDLVIAASATASMAFDRYGRWSPDIDVSALGPSVRPPPLRLLPTVEVGDGRVNGGIDVRIGAQCARRPCDAGDAYLQGIHLLASLDGRPLAADTLLLPGVAVAAIRGKGTLSIQAVDVFGHVSEPATLTLTGLDMPPMLKANQAPSVTMTAPPNNGLFVPGSNITLSATASDSDGTVTKVEFFRSGTLIGTSSLPWSFVWPSVPAGNYSLTAKATDDKGASKTSSSISIVVKAAPNVAPTISIGSPMPASTVNGPTVTITTNAKDTDGTVSKVEFYEGTKLLGTATGGASTLSASWIYRDITAGSHTIRAVATDNSGASTSASVSFNVNAAPFAVLTSPIPCSEIIFPGNIVLTADAHDSDGVVSRVDFYRGTTLLGSATAPPYRYTLTMPPVGDYTFTATAIDRQGASGTSTAVSVGVRVPDVPPIVSMATPLSGARFGKGAPVSVSAVASDADGMIRKVEFYAASLLIGSASAAPYSIVWRPASNGTIALTAKATDDRGVATTSQPVSITIVDNIAPTAWLEVPGNSAVLAPDESIDLVTKVSDADGVVRKVEFLIGKPYELPSRSLGTVYAAPFTLRFTMDQAGARYWVVARATDDLGATSNSQSVWLSGNSAPSVAITSPAEGALFLPGAKIAIAATASDSESNFYRGIPEVWVNGQLRWRGGYSSYNSDTGQLALGTFPFDPGLDVTLVVRGVDTKGAESYSTPVHFRTAPLPSVEVLTPKSGETIAVSSPIRLTTKASQPLGSIVRVNYYSGGSVIGTSITAPYEVIWTPPFSGSTTDVQVIAEAIDNLGTGGTATSEPVALLIEPVRLEITGPTREGLMNEDLVRVTGTYVGGSPSSITVNGVPAIFGNGTYEATVSLPIGPFTIPQINDPHAKLIRVLATTARGNAVRELWVRRYDPEIVVHASSTNSFVAPSSIDLSADTIHFARSITRVEYLVNNGVVASAFSPPWHSAWNVSKAGQYSVSARAIDESGKAYSAPGVGISIFYGIGAHITNPPDGASFAQGSYLAVTATMRPPQGLKISRLELLMDNAVVTTEDGVWDDLTWQIRLQGVPLGQHIFSVRLKDSSGASMTSESVRASVVQGPVLTLLSPRQGTLFRTGGLVTLLAKVVTAGSPIPYVDFFANGIKVARVTNEPYAFTWEGVAAGIYELKASTVDGGLPFNAVPISITVGEAALNIERPSDVETVYEPWVVVGGNYDAADAPQSILVNGLAATWANGMFSARVPLSMGNNVITVAAEFHSQTIHTGVVVNRADASITFANVANADVIHNDTVTIRGVVRGPRNSGLLVNGKPASKSATGDFFINVPLKPGINSIVFQLVKQDDTVVEWPLTLTRDGMKPFVVSVTPSTGYSLPLRSLLTVRTRAPVDYSTLQLLDRGTVVFEEIVSGEKSERAYVLETHDYVSTDLAIRLLDSAGREVFQEPAFTRVSKPEELDGEIRNFFGETLHRLTAGDLSGGSTAYLPQLQQDYKTLYEDLGSNVPSLMEMMRNIGSITLSERSAEIIVHRMEQDGLRGFPVGLMRDAKGIWRISGM